MKLGLITVGKGSPSWADDAVADYGRRIRRFGGLQETTLKPEPFKGDVDAVRHAEGKRILGAIKPRDRLVALDERGERLSTEAFAAMLRQGMGAEGRCIFALGGPYGHSPAVRDAAWKSVRLSDLVLNHQVARVLFYEQVYRAFTLMNGVPYHH